MRVLIGCEESGTVRRAFRKLGYDAYSCDFKAARDKETTYHIQGNVLDVLNEGWDLMIAHPNCQWLAVSGIHWNYRGRNGLLPFQCWEETAKAVDFFLTLAHAPIPYIALENPKSIISSRWRTYDQVIQPYQYGHDASKQTCLWLKGLPKLISKESSWVPGRVVVRNGKRYSRWANQTDSGQNKLGPSKHRSADRATTYPGIAKAMAEQWGGYVVKQLESNIFQTV